MSVHLLFYFVNFSTSILVDTLTQVSASVQYYRENSVYFLRTCAGASCNLRSNFDMEVVGISLRSSNDVSFIIIILNRGKYHTF